MKKNLLTFIAIISLAFVFSACGSKETAPKEGELKEVDKETFIKLLDKNESQPFLFISTDAKEDLFSDTAKPIYEDYLEQNSVGAYYLNVNDLSDEEIDEINNFGSTKNDIEKGSEYDASSDGLVLVRKGEIEKITSRIVFNQNTLSNKEEYELFEENGFEKQLHEDIKKNVNEVVEQLSELN